MPKDCGVHKPFFTGHFHDVPSHLKRAAKQSCDLSPAGKCILPVRTGYWLARYISALLETQKLQYICENNPEKGRDLASSKDQLLDLTLLPDRDLGDLSTGNQNLSHRGSPPSALGP